ncbi:MAG: small subunit ribosomal protein S16 [Candidatus Latescibacterota bacterium]
MVRLRLLRMGSKKAPFYRVVAANSSAPRDGRFIEILGHYNPTKHPQIVELKTDRVQYWLGVGAQPSDTVRSLFRQQGILKLIHEARQAPGASSEAVPEA